MNIYPNLHKKNSICNQIKRFHYLRHVLHQNSSELCTIVLFSWTDILRIYFLHLMVHFYVNYVETIEPPYWQ